MDTPTDLIGLEEMRARFGNVSRSFFYRLKRHIQGHHFGGLKYRLADVLAYIDAQCKTAPPLPKVPTGRPVRPPADEEIMPGVYRSELEKTVGF